MREGREQDGGAAPSADDFFQPGGLLAARMPGWEDRQGQLEMAREVEAAVGEARNLVVEAGTGTGKTLAYLVPLVLARRRAVISTGTKNLQDQLLRKDIPLLERVLGQRLPVAVMKGRTNFLCLDKVAEQERKPTLTGLAETEEFARIREWAQKTETGDRADLRGLRADSRLWPRLDARRETCAGRKCALFDDCFLTKMHQRARSADLVIVNHHLYFADLSLRRDDFGPLIPSHYTVVFDEAHEMESVAGQYFGLALSEAKIESLARDTLAAAKKAGFGSAALNRAARALLASSKAFFKLFEEFAPRQAFTERAAFRTRNAGKYAALRSGLDGFSAQLSLIPKHAEATGPLVERARELSLTLRTILLDMDDRARSAAYGYPGLEALLEDHAGNFVHWIEKRRKGAAMRVTPIEIGPILEERLFGQDGSVVLASATLAVDGSFDYIRRRLGVRASNESLIPSHFNYSSQVMLYVPRALPAPNSDTFPAAAAREIRDLLDITSGRAFVLFTSYKQMREVHRRVSGQVPYPTLLQGEGPNAELLDSFRKTNNCVLFATYSFWHGVDVPGERLSCVIIDKLPFAVPSDPIVRARADRIAAEGGIPFRDYHVPQAALTLKQGFGRLIRTGSDRGVLALLDRRIVTKQYGRIFLKSLPAYQRAERLEEVAHFFSRRP